MKNEYLLLVFHGIKTGTYLLRYPAQISLAWLLAQKPWIVPIPGTTKLPHLDENLGAIAVKFSAEELRELNAAASKITVQGARLPQPSLELTRREAPLRN